MNCRITFCLLAVLASAGGSLLVAGPCDPPTPVGTPCDDGNACTTGDACNAEGLCGGAAIYCHPSGDPMCNGVYCDPATGCVNVPLTGQSCFQGGDSCLPGTCVNGYCSAHLKDCDDGNPCTFDWCRPMIGQCRHDPVAPSTPCNVGLCPGYCTAAGACTWPTGGDDPACDDDNYCTQDFCEPATGCYHDNFDGRWCDADQDLCTGAFPGGGDSCMGGVCVPGPLVDCSDGNNCTSDACNGTTGCDYTSNGSCGKNPEDLVYWQQLCESPPVSGEFISQQDVDCVRLSCTFATVASVTDVCDRLIANPHNDKCEKAEAQLMALLLNVCRGRTPVDLSIHSRCSDHTTVGQSRAEADGMLCSPLRDAGSCRHAACLSEEISSGRALRLGGGGIQVAPVED